MAVSPGGERGVALVGQTCPTFSWTAVDWASGYRTGKTDSKPQCKVGAMGSEGNNTLYGFGAGVSITSGLYNTFIGQSAGYSTTAAYNNTFLGDAAGYSNSGNNNVFLGYQAGYNVTGSAKLYISNNSTTFPLVYGDFSNEFFAVNGWLGIGTQIPSYP